MSAYQDDHAYLEGQFRLLDLRIKIQQAGQVELWDDDLLCQDGQVDLHQELEEMTAAHRKRLAAAEEAGHTFTVEELARQCELDEFERDLLLLLVYKQFVDTPFLNTGHALLSVLAKDRLALMRLTRSLRVDGRLRGHRLVICDQHDPQANLLEATYDLSPTLLSELTGFEPCTLPEVETTVDPSYRGYLEFWFKRVALMEHRLELMTTLRQEDPLFGDRVLSGLGQPIESLEAQMGRLDAKIAEYERRDPDAHAQFPLERIGTEHDLSVEEKSILVILLRNSLGLGGDCFMGLGCDGKKLLAIVSASETSMIRNRQLLYNNGTLRTADLVRQERGWPGQNFLDAEYELPEPMIRRLLGHLTEGAGPGDKSSVETSEESLYRMTEPRFTLDDVILDPAKKERLVVALQQEQHHELIFEKWGFGEAVPGQSGLSILISGPPGTGKTMLAEAIASYLGQKLLLVDYSQVQNLFVGETEKRIVGAFKQARESGGVLVWDEADAMFYSRDSATQSWENRDVNVILQEIERHPGVVVLTTNRKRSLDAALDRRMGVKVELFGPGPREREQIWQRHIPVAAPVANDVNTRALAQLYDVTGGQIRNAVLAAARAVAARGGEHPGISMRDLVSAIEEEIDAGWSEVGRGRLGF